MSSLCVCDKNLTVAIKMATLQLVLAVLIFCSSRIFSQGSSLNVSSIYCPYFRNAPSLNAQDLVGSWLTVYTQPKTIDCFTLHVRATTDLEREQNVIKYGNFSGRVEWESCLLEVKSPLGKHFLQGSGSEAGLFENIILTRAESGKNTFYKIEEQSADQWSIYGRRGSEVLVMRDCLGEAAAAFARAPYWPGAEALHAVLHRSGVAPAAQGRVLCEPRIQQAQAAPLSMSRYFSDKY